MLYVAFLSLLSVSLSPLSHPLSLSPLFISLSFSSPLSLSFLAHSLSLVIELPQVICVVLTLPSLWASNSSTFIFLRGGGQVPTTWPNAGLTGVKPEKAVLNATHSSKTFSVERRLGRYHQSRWIASYTIHYKNRWFSSFGRTHLLFSNSVSKLFTH